jgi:hypothetical protein
MDEARGKVLFIDEAHGLIPDGNSYRKDALVQLVGNLTDPHYEGNMIVIFAGYTSGIDDLLDCDPGLMR